MSSPQVPPPGLADQSRVRNALRVAGVVLVVVSLILIVSGAVDFFGAMSSEDGQMPHRFWLFFVGFPLLVLGVGCLASGLLGAASRYAAGEEVPVLRDTAAQLTEGHGILGVGAVAPAGHRCAACGRDNDADARFCDACGTALA